MIICWTPFSCAVDVLIIQMATKFRNIAFMLKEKYSTFLVCGIYEVLLKFFLTALRTLIFLFLKLEVEPLYLVPIIDEFFPNQCLCRILLQLIKREYKRSFNKTGAPGKMNFLVSL